MKFLKTAEQRLNALRWSFGALLLYRLLFPFFNSPLLHLYSDPGRHWNNAGSFLHPDVMGSGDPYLYQLVLFLMRMLPDPWIVLGCGVFCALMPLGWYRTLRELLPQAWAYAGAILIGVAPSLLVIYGYFMTETMLLTLTSFAFAATLRARRKLNFSSFTWAAVFWIAAAFTRIVVWPIAILSLLWILYYSSKRWPQILAGAVIVLSLAIPASLHTFQTLKFYSPFGNLFLNEVYRHSGKKVIRLDFGEHGSYEFGSPSFYNPTFFPFSDWTTDRDGVVQLHINVNNGKEDWKREDADAIAHRSFSKWTDFVENALYFCFGEAWPESDMNVALSSGVIWTRWLWVPLMLFVLIGSVRRRFVRREWLLPLSGLLTCGLLLAQQQSVMEARYRKPAEPIMLAAAVILIYRWRQTRRPDPAGDGTDL